MSRIYIDKDSQAKLMRIFDPEEVKPNLILASIYIATFEILKNSIIDNIKNFYITGFDVDKYIVDSSYYEKVLSKDRSTTYASLKWLKESGVIDDEDIEKFNEAKQVRNFLAHGITKMLMEGLPSDFVERLTDMVNLVDKIERWWIVNVDIPTDPYLAGKEIDENKIISGPIMGLRVMLDVALGSDEEANAYINEFKKQMGQG